MESGFQSWPNSVLMDGFKYVFVCHTYHAYIYASIMDFIELIMFLHT